MYMDSFDTSPSTSGIFSHNFPCEITIFNFKAESYVARPPPRRRESTCLHKCKQKSKCKHECCKVSIYLFPNFSLSKYIIFQFNLSEISTVVNDPVPAVKKLHLGKKVKFFKKLFPFCTTIINYLSGYL